MCIAYLAVAVYYTVSTVFQMALVALSTVTANVQLGKDLVAHASTLLLLL